MKHLTLRRTLLLAIAIGLGGVCWYGFTDAHHSSHIREKQLGHDPEREAKLQLVCPSPDRLRLVQTVPIDGSQVVLPIWMTVSSAGDVFIADNNAHKIVRLRPTSSSGGLQTLSGEKEEAIQWPNQLRVVGNILYVKDQSGLKCIPLKGGKSRTIGSFYSMADFDVDPQGNIFAVPMFREADSGNPLVVEFGADGRSIRHYKTPIPDVKRHSLTNRGLITLCGDKFAVAYEHRPILVVGDRSSGRTQAISLDFPALSIFAALDRDPQFTDARESEYRLCRYVAGLTAIGGRILVLLDLPYVLIQQYNTLGIPTGTYAWKPPAPISRYLGMAVDPARRDTIAVGVAYGTGDYRVIFLELDRS